MRRAENEATRGGLGPPCILTNMEIEEKQARRVVPFAGAVECRACPVICERVVNPVHCLRTRCRYVYAYCDDGVVFFGCVEKVFAAELDIAPHLAHPRRNVYGMVKAVRRPLPQCRHRVERAYEYLYDRRECVNPTFAQHPDEYTPAAVHRLVHGRRVGARGAGAEPPARAG